MLPVALDLTGLTVRHGDALAVDGLDLRIGRDETVALLGPNGAGGSTTVSAVLGLLRPAGGSIRVLGRTPTDAVRAAALAGFAAVFAGLAVLVARRRPLTAVAG